MGNTHTQNILNEIEYRLLRLKKIIPYLETKRIAVYGTGINAKRVLNCLHPLKIIGLMDANSVGRFYYGKKVLSDEEVQLLGIDTVLIAAEPESVKIVYQRILPFCLQNHITMLNMYGCNEIDLHRVIKQQELDYASLTEEYLQNKIRDYEVVFFSFQETLCLQTSDLEEIFDIVDDKAGDKGIADFKRNRILVQKRLPRGLDMKLKDIYTMLSMMTGVDKECALQLMETEKDTILKSLIPRESMLAFFKYVQSCKKDIFICADIMGGEDIVKTFLDKYGIRDYNMIATDRESIEILTGNAIRTIRLRDDNKKILFIGSNQENRLILPQLYGADIQLIEDSMTMFWNYGGFGSCRADMEKREDFNQIAEIAKKIYNSPFLCENDAKQGLKQIGEMMGWQEEFENASERLEQFPLPKWSKKEEVEKLSFRKEEEPIVSVIIPVHNQFAYTYNCLKSILLNTGNIKYEIILADDCSTDWTKSIEDFVDGIKVIHNRENLQFVRNCNQASKYAEGKYLLFLNNDTQVQLNWLFPLVKTLEENEEIGLAGSKLLFPDGRLQEAGGIVWNNGSAWNYGREQNPNAPEFSYMREVDYISGASVLITRQLWSEIGGFDERFAPAYYEDTDLAFEVRRRGKKVVYQPSSEVIHFEGMTNGKNISEGAKSYQTTHRDIFYKKWKEILLKENQPVGQNVLCACERKISRKTVLFISGYLPAYDKAAGSRSIDFYITEFIRRGYIVKFFPDNCIAEEPYAYRLQQMGVEIFSGKYYKLNFVTWLHKHHTEIDYAFLNFPDVSYKYVDILKNLGIPVRYYGHDLHYLRCRREYELLGGEERLETSKAYYQKESYLIQKCDMVYYPSQVEVEIVRDEFHKKEVRQIMLNIYDENSVYHKYCPAEREGLMFVGNYRHAPNVDAVLWFISEIFPAVYDKLKIPFYILGTGMPIEVKKAKLPGIIVIDSPTDGELEEMYRKVKMVVVPLRYGAGIKGKIIEAMYYGVPTVTTSIGAEGIPDEEGAFTVADDSENFIRAVCDVCQDEKELKRISEAGKRLITRHFSRDAAWNRIREDFQ